ncbi:unnamed protein product [Fraxinus pennsylvanica]|uniref:VIN3-like C-terminal domain-containing protein n=1 Tax=Fraxinus pennsylvanica TaxID=56036 RepID=A0AAD2E0U7_9LAMI|nr:unnamed protein product [Fraxinus pennsylvanica]
MIPVPEESSRDEQRNAGQAVEVDNREMRDFVSTPTNESPSAICNGAYQKGFRLKMLTRFSLRSTEAQRQIVCTYTLTITDDPSSLAGQLLGTFSDVISSGRQ